MPAKPVTVGKLHFKKKGDANSYFQEMLYRYELGDKVSNPDSETLSYLLLGHPDADEKIGVGIKSFSVRSADFGTRCFWVNRLDGTTEKFSFRGCY